MTDSDPFGGQMNTAGEADPFGAQDGGADPFSSSSSNSDLAVVSKKVAFEIQIIHSTAPSLSEL